MPSPERAPNPQIPEKKNEIARVLENMRKFDSGLSPSARIYRALDYMEIRNEDDRRSLHAQAMGMLRNETTKLEKAREARILRDARRHEQEIVGSGDDAQEILGAA